MEYPSSWTCEITLVKLDLYLIGTLPRSESLNLAEHLEACSYCAQLLVLRRLGPAGPDQENRLRSAGRRRG